MKLSDWQRIASFYDEENDEVEQAALLICDIYGFSPEQVDQLSPAVFQLYSYRVKRLFDRMMRRPWWCRLRFQTDATQITFGQFVEIKYFLQQGAIDAMHLVAASIQIGGYADHKIRAERLRQTNARNVLPDVNQFMVSFNALIDSYSGLFEKEEEEEDIDEAPRRKEAEHPFITQYGWIFSAKKVAEHEGMKLEEVFGIPVIQALNDLAYLKGEASYMKKINK